MAQKLSALFISFLSISTFAQLSPNTLLNSKQISEDMDILHQSIDEGVIEVYWYRDSISFRKTYDSICALEEGMSFIDFYREVTGMVSSMGCLHSYIEESPLDNYFTEHSLFFPFGVQNTNERSIISYSNNLEIPVGSMIESINGKSITSIRTEMFKIYGTDGRIPSIPKYGTQNEDFAYFYKHYVDTSQSFKIEFQTPENIMHTIEVEGENWNTLSALEDFEKVKFNEYPYAFNIIKGAGILNIETSALSEYNERKWSKFLIEIFNEIEEKNISNLVIDVRRNSGGWMPHMSHLVEYFCNQSFVPVTEAWQKKETYDFFKYSESPKKNFIKNKNRDLDSIIGNSQYDNWLTGAQFEPKEEYFFDGEVYILTGGDTHSAASRLVSMAKEFTDAKIIGDYPGGCFIGGSGGNTVNVILPNSKINVNLALTFFKPAWFDFHEKGKAVTPDYFIEQEIGKDAAMDFTIDIIQKTFNK